MADPYNQYSHDRPTLPAHYQWNSPPGKARGGAINIFHGGAGAAGGIGPISEIGPGGAHAGRIVGMVPALKFAGDVAGPLAAAYMGMRKRVKEYNDTEGFKIEGVSRGRPVLTGGPRGGQTPPFMPPRFSGGPSGPPLDRDNPIF